MSDFKPFRVFNGEIANVATKAFGGEASGILDYDDIKYPIMLDINKDLFGEYWIENEIRLGEDIRHYKQALTENEQDVYNIITGSLTALDSFATKFNFALGSVCSDPSILANIAIINSFEVLHNRSYQYLSSTMLNSAQKKRAFNAPKEIPLLREKLDLVIIKIQKMIDTIAQYVLNGKEFDRVLLDAIYEGLLANLLLEGEFFTGGFVYFHSLAKSQRMIGSNNMINLIKEDETQHSAFYGNLMKILMLENPELNTQERHDNSIEFIKTCTEKEKEWGSYIFKEIDTISIKEYNDYVEYLANVICRNAGLKEVYPENTILKSKWILTYGSKKRGADEDAIATKQDFFQTNVIDYGHEGGEGFDL
jgi:ribonucleoside-diphosphate reductase beta chain